MPPASTLQSNSIYLEDWTDSQLTLVDSIVDLSKHAVTEEILELLLALAEESQVLEHARRMITGQTVNTSENRPVLHMGLRNPAPPLPDEFIEQVKAEQTKLDSLSRQIREWGLDRHHGRTHN